MAKVFIEESTLTKIGNSIRNKTGKTDLIDPAVMDVEIDSIETGGSIELPEEAFSITGDCQYRFTYNSWNWFVDMFGDKVNTTGINKTYQMFANSDKLTKIPFTLNITNCSNLGYTFDGCRLLRECPKIRGTISWSTSTVLNELAGNCGNIRDLDDLFEPSMLDGYSNVKVTSQYSCPRPFNLKGCYSLRKVPVWWYKFNLNPESTVAPAATYCLYQYSFQYCYALDEAMNIPVWRFNGTQTSNMFTYAFAHCYRLENLTFETQADGAPYVANWKSQVLDLSNSLGYTTSFMEVTKNYNSGITTDKEVKDDTTYQSLKNDPDWFATKIEYSRYNHDSAVATINSLPDTSAAGGTNTIKFKGTSGSLTDGGAINTLTEEEIAVATAKGWTVTLV